MADAEHLGDFNLGSTRKKSQHDDLMLPRRYFGKLSKRSIELYPIQQFRRRVGDVNVIQADSRAPSAASSAARARNRDRSTTVKC